MRSPLGFLLALILCSAALAQGPIPSTGPSDPRLAPIDALFTSFIRSKKAPGAAVAIAKGNRLLYARGFGVADPEHGEPVQPDSLFRIASVSKPLTSAAIMKLVDAGKLRLEDHPFELLGVHPPEGKTADPRLASITVRDLLTHAGGFDRGKSGDPMFMSRQIASELRIASPPGPADIVRWMAGRPLDFAPGTKSAYSNFGYCVLGRVVEHASGKGYERYVQDEILKPLGIARMRIGATLASGRMPGEVSYVTTERSGPSVFDATPGTKPNPYGPWCLESMDSHGGWIASAPDLVRFAVAVGEPGRVLKADSLHALWARPSYEDPKAAAYYAFGWMVRPVGSGMNTWHNGSLPGTSTLLVRRHDGFVWAVLFNSREGDPAGQIDGLMHRAVDEVKEWPAGEPLFTAESLNPRASGGR
jgi:N-acyl-D-amino-acid deacylase